MIRWPQTLLVLQRRGEIPQIPQTDIHRQGHEAGQHRPTEPGVPYSQVTGVLLHPYSRAAPVAVFRCPQLTISESLEIGLRQGSCS